MFFVYLLAFIGLATLLLLATLAIALALRAPSAHEPEDPIEEALDAVNRLQAGAWSAIRQLRDLERKQ